MDEKKKYTIAALVKRIEAITGIGNELPYLHECQWFGPPADVASENALAVALTEAVRTGQWAAVPQIVRALGEVRRPRPWWFTIGHPLPMNDTTVVFAIFQNDDETRVYTLGLSEIERDGQRVQVPPQQVLPPMRLSLNPNAPTYVQMRFNTIDSWVAEIAEERMALYGSMATILHMPGEDGAVEEVLDSEIARDERAAKWAREHGYADPGPIEDDDEEEDDEKSDEEKNSDPLADIDPPPGAPTPQ